MPIDYSKYPPTWKSEIRPRILNRANNKCEVCGVKNHEFIFRGFYKGQEVYQYPDSSIFSFPEGEFITCDYEVDPVRPNQKAIKVVLTIAHLDHDEENWHIKDERLMAMCQKCHLTYDAPEKKRRKSNQISLEL